MHEQFLLAALEQAKLGRGLCAPNPSVGAVAVQKEKIIAQAWHKGAGTPHAEPLLLAQIPPKTPGVSVYITLEPCNHWGRTPPCVDALIAHGVEEVVYAYADPNPIVAENDSSARLRAQGITVRHVPLKEIDTFYDSYSYWTRTGLPRVTVKLAHSLDGMIGHAEGERVLLTNDLCAQFTHEMRAAADVILTSARTVALDNPQMNVRLNNTTQAKPVAILDSQLSLDTQANIFTSASHCLVYHAKTPQKNYPNSSFYEVPTNANGLDLSAVMHHLGQLGFHDVWVEAGGAVFSALHKAGLVHRTYLYIAPLTLGPDAVPAYQKTDIFSRPHVISWHVMGNNVVACVDWQEGSCLQD